MVAMPRWGTGSIPRLSALNDKATKGTAAPAEIEEISALNALGKLTKGFICEVYQLKKVNGKWVKDVAGYNPPPFKISNDIGGIGGLPYGYS
jgi:hypothetical protein